MRDTSDHRQLLLDAYEASRVKIDEDTLKSLEMICTSSNACIRNFFCQCNLLPRYDTVSLVRLEILLPRLFAEIANCRLDIQKVINLPDVQVFLNVRREKKIADMQ